MDGAPGSERTWPAPGHIGGSPGSGFSNPPPHPGGLGQSSPALTPSPPTGLEVLKESSIGKPKPRDCVLECS